MLALLRGISRSEFVLPQRGGSRERELDPADEQRADSAKEAEREAGEGSAEAQRALRGEVVEEGEGVHENKSPPHRGGGIPPPA